MSTSSSLSAYKVFVKKRLASLAYIFERASHGDFSKDLKLPSAEDEFTELYVSVQVVVEVIRAKIKELHAANSALAKKVREKQAVLEALQAEKNMLAEFKLNYEAILQSIGEGMVMVDRRMRITMFNHMAEVTLGLQKSEVLGKVIHDVIALHNQQGEKVLASVRPLEQALRARKTIVSQRLWYFKRPDGHTVPLKVTASPVMKQREVIGALAVFRDTTYEQEIDQAKTKFVSLASHQLRTPLTMINWYIERILQEKAGKTTPKQRQYLEEVYRGGKRMGQLVQGLLNVSRLELKTLQLEPAWCDIPQIVKQLLKELADSLAQKEVVITQEFDPASKRVYMDPALLRVILQNLLSNAARYSRAGSEVKLSVAFRTTPTNNPAQGQHSLFICVSDRGVGIPKQDQAKIFHKLFRSANVTQFDTIGNGLGLYVVKSMVNHAHGQIWFTSEENKGTQFFVMLPLTEFQPAASKKNV